MRNTSMINRPPSPFYTIPIKGSHIPARYDLMTPLATNALLEPVENDVHTWLAGIETAQELGLHSIVMLMDAGKHLYNGNTNFNLVEVKHLLTSSFLALEFLIIKNPVLSEADDLEPMLDEELKSTVENEDTDYHPTGMPTGIRIVAQVMEFGANVRGYPEGNILPRSDYDAPWYCKHQINHAIAHLVSYQRCLMLGINSTDEDDVTHALCRTYFALMCLLDGELPKEYKSDYVETYNVKPSSIASESIFSTKPLVP